jgi:hypothetical protein
VLLDGQPVFLCCASCEEKAKANPRKTLETVEALKKSGTAPAPAPQPPSAAGEEARVRANLDTLPREERPLAAAQKFCPVTEERLGDPAMGVPVKVLVEGQPVFLCCKSCQKAALKDAAGTLAKVKELKARAKK